MPTNAVITTRKNRSRSSVYVNAVIRITPTYPNSAGSVWICDE